MPQNFLRRTLLLALLLALALAPLAAQQPGKAPERESVKPGINETWKSPDIDPLVDTLEAESREIYRERERLADLIGLRPGMTVADVGAGSGFMALEFARRVGAQGKVYAVDINAKMLELVAQRASQAGLENIVTVLGREDDTTLPPATVDLVFLCDTYHHFEYPDPTMASIRRALKPGGEIILVEFHRKPGESPDWVLEHVRAGQAEFTRELEGFGFHLVREHGVPWLAQNYVLRFRKAERPAALSVPAGIRDGGLGVRVWGLRPAV